VPLQVAQTDSVGTSPDAESGLQEGETTKGEQVKLIVLMGVIASAAVMLFGIPANATPPPSVCDNGQTFNPVTQECVPNSTQVTYCHVAGLASDPANLITLTTAIVAAVGPAGHFGENGTPNAGHEQDYWGPCEVPPPPENVRVCDPATGDIIEVPEDEADQYLPADDPACEPPCEETLAGQMLGCEDTVFVCWGDEVVEVPVDEADDPQYHPTDPENDPNGHCSNGDNPDAPTIPNTPDNPTPDAPPILTGGNIPDTR